MDDLLIFWKIKEKLEQMKAALCSSFKMKDLGVASSCIGIRISHESDSIALDQSAYIANVIERFKMSEAHPVATPSDPNQKLSIEMSPTTEDEGREMAGVPYQSLVGCLLYIAQCTRPDIAFAVNDVSRFNTNYGRAHWMAAKRILRYLKATIDFKLRYSKSTCSSLVGYCDSDWASDVDKRRSCTGYMFKLSNGAITWDSKRQATVALSSTEAEYLAISWATREAIWLQSFGRELDRDMAQTVELLVDNQSAIKLANSNGYHQRTKHIDVRHHHVRNKIEDGTIKLTYVPSEENAADVLAKGLTGPKTQSCVSLMGLQ